MNIAVAQRADSGAPGDSEPSIAAIVDCLEPTGDLRRIVLDDMDAEEERELFAILDIA